MDENTKQSLKRPFPQELHKSRKGPEGKQLIYVEVQAYVDRLNEAFGHDWSFELTSKEVVEDQAIVEVRLTTAGLVKTGLGGAQLTRRKDDRQIISLADDYKKAEADALKRACRLLGIGADLYASESDGAEPSTVQPAANAGAPSPAPTGVRALPPRERLTSAQLNAIKAIAKKQAIDPVRLRHQIKQRYGVEIEYLNKRQASEVIGALDAHTQRNAPSAQHAWAGG